MEAKDALRARVLARRDALTPLARERKSLLVCRQIIHLIEAFEAEQPAPSASSRSLYVSVYASMRSEVDLQPLIDAAYTRGWNLCFPCMVRDTPESFSRMAFYHVPLHLFASARAAFLDAPLRCLTCESLTAAGYREMAPEEIDVVIVPLVAFDANGHRLGYGGGNYDRFLSKIRDGALVVGAAFEEQRTAQIPLEPHDLSIPHIASA